MSFEVITIKEFERELKRLSKKYVSLKYGYLSLIESLETNPIEGTPLGNDCYKIRLNISSKGKGKRGGGRVIIQVKIIDKIVYLLAIYDKSEQQNNASTPQSYTNLFDPIFIIQTKPQ